MDKNQNKVANINKCSQFICQNNKLNLGLSNYTYADFVILSSTLAYAISCELTDEDLDFFIVFLIQVSGDLALLRTKRGYEQIAVKGSQVVGEEEILEEAEANEAVDVSLESGPLRHKKRKKVKRKKIKKKRI